MNERGLVVARYRRHCLVQNDRGERIACQIGSRSLNPVAGDAIEWLRESEDRGTMTAVLPRKTELTRIDSRGKPEVVAANLSQLVVVLAPAPAPDWFLLDRYLAAAELNDLKSVVAFNKVDLIKAPPAELAVYESLTDAVCTTSAKRGDSLDELRERMAGERSVLIGQSGVGKSSLINALLGDERQAVNELSEKGGHGRHTTSTAVLYSLPSGGELIDSPGVRDYAPYISDSRDVQHGFRDFTALPDSCRFDDCRHLAEPDCAVKAAVADGRIDARRYESFTGLLELTESFLEKNR